MAADDAVEQQQRRRAMLEDRFRQSTRNANMGGRLSETSVQTYASKILAAMEVAGYDDPDELVRNPQAAYPKLERHFGGDGRETVATLRGAVSAVLALIKADDRLRYDKRGTAHKAWTAFHRKLVKARDERLKRSEPTAAQAAKYVGFDEIENRYSISVRLLLHPTCPWRDGPHTMERPNFRGLFDFDSLPSEEEVVVYRDVRLTTNLLGWLEHDRFERAVLSLYTGRVAFYDDNGFVFEF